MRYIGIDFGTTNSAVAVYDPDQDKVLASDYEGTLIYFEETKEQICHLGARAIEKYLEHDLRGRFIRSIKSVLHSEAFKFTYIYGRKYFAEDLVALVLRNLKKIGEEIAGAECDKVVLGRPAKFSPDPKKDQLAQDRLLRAAKKAGFAQVVFQLEPIAAAFSYENELSHEELVFVGDLGGGTADFTVMRLGGKRRHDMDRAADILGATGVRVGGDDFDAAVAWHKIVQHLGLKLQYDPSGRGKWLPIPPHYYRRFCRWEKHFLLNAPTTLRDIENYLKWTGGHPQIAQFLTILKENLGYAIFKSIENAKKALTTADSATIAYQHTGHGIDLHETVDLTEFTGMIQPEMQGLTDCMDSLLAQTGLRESDIDAVFLTGGSSLVRPVHGLFAERFGAEKIRQQDAFTSVANGLALYGRALGAAAQN